MEVVNISMIVTAGEVGQLATRNECYDILFKHASRLRMKPMSVDETMKIHTEHLRSPRQYVLVIPTAIRFLRPVDSEPAPNRILKGEVLAQAVAFRSSQFIDAVICSSVTKGIFHAILPFGVRVAISASDHCKKTNDTGFNEEFLLIDESSSAWVVVKKGAMIKVLLDPDDPTRVEALAPPKKHENDEKDDQNCDICDPHTYLRDPTMQTNTANSGIGHTLTVQDAAELLGMAFDTLE